ncbi:MAG: sugar ABC transporter substrate-binding protein [Chloroflexi bacterium]|nr:sugar ABC transporter substrate-binding protein [Chloroflexota bacterium]
MRNRSSINPLLLLVVVVVLTFAVAACAAPAAAPTTAPAPASAAPAAAQPSAADYAAYKPILGAYSPVPLAAASQAACKNLAYKPGSKPSIAYMPPATEFDYYIAIGEGVKAQAAQLGADTYMSAPQSGSDINGQMGMLQDVITKKADAIIFSTHDENAAAPLVKRAVDAGIAVIIVNSDIPTFPAPVHAVVGYGQRRGTYKMGMYVAGVMHGVGKLGALEGQPGWHSTERIGGYLDALSQFPQIVKVASLPTAWNVETGNSVMMDMMQAHPEINVVVAANDYEAIGAAKAAQSLNRKDILIFGNDGDTTGMEQILAGTWNGTVNTTPFEMGEVAMQVAWDCLNGKYPGGWTETPVVIVDKTNVINYLCHPERLYPKPSKTYDCPK